VRSWRALLAVALVVLLLGGATLVGLLAPPPPLEPAPRGAVFANVTVVNPGAGRARRVSAAT
jgi:hypothetical protein